MKKHLKLDKILIAVENSSYSELASEYGFLLAQKMKADVALVHVNDLPMPIPPVSDPLLTEPQSLIPELLDVQETAGKQLLERISKQYGAGQEIYTFNRLGSPQGEILATAEEWNADLIILGTHGRTGLDHFISGSVAEGVARKAKCPVLIIPKGEG